MIRTSSKVVAVIVIGCSIIFFIILNLIRKREFTAVSRGEKIAARLGCFTCHGPGGLEGTANPGQESVPAWNGGTAMMYLEKDEHIREYILYGKRLDEQDSAEGLIRMPAYRAKISSSALEELVAYVKAVSLFYPEMPDEARPGMELARDKGCFGCHGPAGRGGQTNPGAFKRYIPGWDGKHFNEAVRNSAELREWIMTGEIQRWKKNPLARFFTGRQVIRMPAYQEVLTEDEFFSINKYIQWLREKKE